MSHTISPPPRKAKEERSMSFVTRACDTCRKKKIRCEVGSGPTDICVQCTKYKTRCHFTPISVKRMPKRSVRDKRIEELEERLKWMEKQLVRVVKTETDPMVLGTPSPDGSLLGTYSDPNTNEDDSFDSAQRMAEMSRRSSYFGAGSETTSISAPDGHIILSPWNLASAKSVSAQKIVQALPPKDKALQLIRRAFDGFHSAYPIFDKHSFMKTFEQSDMDIMSDPGWWACLNVVLALNHRFEESTIMDHQAELEAWGFFQNALAVRPQLLTMHSNLASVQALLGMALVLQGTPNQGPVSLLTSSAIKLAQRMGLHRRCQDTSLSIAEIEERKRVFWVAYILDKDISLQTGQPPTQDDDNMDVEFTFEHCSSLNHPGQSCNMEFFNVRVKLALIQGQIYSRLCSVKATRQTACERMVAARELESILRAWRASVPAHFMRDFGASDFESSTSGPLRHPIILQLTYFNSLAIVYGSLPLLPSNCEIKGPDDPLAFQMSTPITYPAEARQVMKLLEATPRRNFASVWSGLHIFVSATTILLTHTLWDPENPFALADLKYCEPLLDLLAVLAKSGESNNIGETYTSCLELYERAKMAVNTFGLGNLAGLNWDQPQTAAQAAERESVEDFLRRMESMSSGYDVDLALMPQSISQDFDFGQQL